MTPNASDRKSVRELEKRARIADRARAEVITSIMSTLAGRSWMWDRLSSCHVFVTTFNGDALQSAFQEGQRSMGLALLAGANVDLLGRRRHMDAGELPAEYVGERAGGGLRQVVLGDVLAGVVVGELTVAGALQVHRADDDPLPDAGVRGAANPGERGPDQPVAENRVGDNRVSITQFQVSSSKFQDEYQAPGRQFQVEEPRRNAAQFFNLKLGTRILKPI